MLLFFNQLTHPRRECIRFGLMKVGGLTFDQNALFPRGSERQPAKNKAWEKDGGQEYQSVAFQGLILFLLLVRSLSAFKGLSHVVAADLAGLLRGTMSKDFNPDRCASYHCSVNPRVKSAFSAGTPAIDEAFSKWLLVRAVEAAKLTRPTVGKQ
jgi:hypothetical protein